MEEWLLMKYDDLCEVVGVIKGEVEQMELDEFIIYLAKPHDNQVIIRTVDYWDINCVHKEAKSFGSLWKGGGTQTDFNQLFHSLNSMDGITLDC